MPPIDCQTFWPRADLAGANEYLAVGGRRARGSAASPGRCACRPSREPRIRRGEPPSGQSKAVASLLLSRRACTGARRCRSPMRGGTIAHGAPGRHLRGPVVGRSRRLRRLTPLRRRLQYRRRADRRPNGGPMLTVHHLNNSRSQRILWLLEELGTPYEIVKYQRMEGNPAGAARAEAGPPARQVAGDHRRGQDDRRVGRHRRVHHRHVRRRAAEAVSGHRRLLEVRRVDALRRGLGDVPAAPRALGRLPRRRRGAAPTAHRQRDRQQPELHRAGPPGAQVLRRR